jgi:hypothetical protein
MDWITIWNRKLHIYTGLYLLLFVWLFAVSGLILNHPKWNFTEFWPQRKQSSFERTIQIPPETSDLAKAKNLMRQLGISGEISWTTTYPTAERLDFRVNKPGKMLTIKTDLKSKLATVEQIRVNAWGVLRLIHEFTGVRLNEPKEQRDWLLTKIWSLSMDAVVIGLLFMVASSFYMWYQLKPKRRLGLVIFGLGIICTGFFVFGLGII